MSLQKLRNKCDIFSMYREDVLPLVEGVERIIQLANEEAKITDDDDVYRPTKYFRALLQEIADGLENYDVSKKL